MEFSRVHVATTTTRGPQNKAPRQCGREGGCETRGPDAGKGEGGHNQGPTKNMRVICLCVAALLFACVLANPQQPPNHNAHANAHAHAAPVYVIDAVSAEPCPAAACHSESYCNLYSMLFNRDPNHMGDHPAHPVDAQGHVLDPHNQHVHSEKWWNSQHAHEKDDVKSHMARLRSKIHRREMHKQHPHAHGIRVFSSREGV